MNDLTRILAAAACLAATSAFAAEPSSGTVSKGRRTAAWTSPAYSTGVPSDLGCVSPENPACDAFELTADLKAGARFAIAITSEVEGDDYDLYVYYPDGTEAGRAATPSGSESLVLVHDPLRATGPYRVRVLPYAVSPGSSYKGIAQATRDIPIETGDVVSCLAPAPSAVGVAGVSDDGSTVSLDVAVLLDGITQDRGAAIMEKAAESYAPMGVRLDVVSWKAVSFTGTEGSVQIAQAKAYYGGAVPEGVDIVYVLTSKDITSDGDTGLAGLADCIGGVRYNGNAFAVGEGSGAALEPFDIGPFSLYVDAFAEVAAHELGHLMGAHHHYANCVEGNLQGEANDLSPCTLMFNYIDFQSMNFSQVNGPVVRGHAWEYARP